MNAQDNESALSRLYNAQRIANIGDWEWDIESDVVSWSPQMFTIFGRNPALKAPCNVKAIADYYDPACVELVAAKVACAVEMGEVQDYDITLVRPDGARVYVKVTAVPRKDANDRVVALYGIVQDVTASKLAERLRRESEERLSFALEAADIGDWDMDLRTNVARHSFRHDQCFGYTMPVAQWGYDTFLAHIFEEDRSRVDRSYQSAMAGEEVYNVEFRVVWPDKSVHWLWSKGRFYFDEMGEPYREAGIQLDITARKLAETALLESNAQRQLLETCIARLNDIVLISEAEPFDQPGPRIDFVNEAFVRRTGFTREEAIGQTPRILQGPKTDRQELDRIRAALQRWEPVRAELINYTKSGEEFWLELDIVPVANQVGRYTHWIAVERDITDRKQAEITVRESEARYRSMFENNPQPMWVFDAQTLAFLSVNDATVAHYGYSRDEFSGMTLKDIRPAQDLARFDTQYALDKHSRATSAQVWTHMRKDGSLIQVEISAHTMDYLGRPARLVLAHDITARLQSQAKVQHLAYHDMLTGLPNRTQFVRFADAVLPECAHCGALGAAILIDLDNFKSINDHWGHRSGDEMLKQVSQRIQQCLSPSGFVARLGGDEFIVVVTEIGENLATATTAAQDLCSKLLASLANVFLIDDREHFISASLGIAFFGEREMSSDELLSRADSAMYSAKADGRNTFRYFDSQLQAQLTAQSELEAELRQSIQNHELYLVYQPQMDQMGKVVGAEALIRWHHPRRGLVSPAQFIPIAESNGFILKIGQWVLHAACQALAQWQTRGPFAGLTVAVNVSAKQFHHPDFVSQVLAELAASGADPTLLKLELTESLLVQDLDGIVLKMNALKAKGITFSLDDFGTGYSSLAYLKRLPLDQLKIDQGFVRDILVDASDAAIVRTIIALGETFGLQVIAEGVETTEQREFLAYNGCHLYQGYLFSRPLKQDDFEKFCKRG